MSMSEIVTYGVIGGLLPDLIRFLKYKYKQHFPKYLTYPTFWVGIMINLALGVLAAWVLAPGTPLQALACGFSAPEILTRVLGKQALTIDRASDEFDLLQWWAG